LVKPKTSPFREIRHIRDKKIHTHRLAAIILCISVYTKIYNYIQNERLNVGNKVFDVLKGTLTDYDPAEYDAAVKKETRYRQQAGQTTPQIPQGGGVPLGRTSVDIQRIGGKVTITPTANPLTAPLPKNPPPPVEPSPVYIEPPLPAEPPPVHIEPVTDTAEPPATVTEVNIIEPPPTVPEPQHEPRTETAAALHVKAAQPPKQKQAPELDDMILMTLRVPLYLKKRFYKTCHDQEKTPSLVLRNLMETFCGFCLVLCILSPCAALAKTDSTGNTVYTTEQIMSYLQNKTFGGLAKNVPAARGTVGARHALWQTGATDPINDFVYSDYSNTRLEAKIEIPIFDLSYLNNRDKEKSEHRAFVLKSLSKILAAHKAVGVTEARITTVRKRHEYVSKQIELKLANKSDLFAIEDNLYSLQAQLSNELSDYEQQVVDLATLAKNDWQEAYQMIIKWDGVLFAMAKGKGK